VWDNIKNGEEIACPEVEKALTSPTIQDRILGVSQGAVVPTNTIQIFVGNNIRFAVDMASRGPEIRLLTDDPNPEDRTVAHADPIADAGSSGGNPALPVHDHDLWLPQSP
jgi:hypothetical protein